MRLVLLLFCITNINLLSIDRHPVIKKSNDHFELWFENLVFKSQTIKSGNLVICDYLQATDETNPGTYKLPKLNIILALPPNIKPEYTFIPMAEIKRPNEIPSLNPEIVKINDSLYSTREITNYSNASKSYNHIPIVVKRYFWLRDYYCVELEISPVIFDMAKNEIIEITSFSIKVTHPGLSNINPVSPIPVLSDYDNLLPEIIANSQIAGQFRSTLPAPQSDSTGNWINYNADYLKIGVVNDLIYRVSKTDFASLGIATSIDPRTLRLFSKGVEIPIYVSGESDGTFDDGDYIEFPGRKNYTGGAERIPNSSNEPYVEFTDRYTDTTYFFLTWGNSPGKRIYVQNLQSSGLSDTLNYYTFFAHIEQNTMYQPSSLSTVINQDPDWTSTNAWVWQWYGTSTLNFTFNVSDLVTGKNGAAYFKAISYASSSATNSHNVTVRVNQTLVDSAVFDRNAVTVTGQTFNSSILTNGNNTLSVKNYANGTSSNLLVTDWYEFEYPRLIRAYNDSLVFQIRDSINRSHRIIKIEDVAQNDFTLYKYRLNQKKIENLIRVGNTVFFSDTVGSGDIYMLLPASKIGRPEYLAKKNFVNLRNTSRSASYITLTNKVFSTEATEYTNFISSSYQLQTSVVFVDDVFDEFNYGYPNPEAIRLFLRTSYANWQAPKPSYLFIIGSASYDYKRNYFKARGYEVNQNLVMSYGEPVSDVYYTMFDPTQPLIPQMHCGRLPVKERSQILYYLEKHRNYLTQRYDRWNKKAIFFSGGDSNTPSQLIEYKAVNDTIISRHTAAPPYKLNYDHFYKTINPQSDFGPYDPLYIKNSIEGGGLFISYIGHSGTRTWDNSISDPNQLLNKVNKSSLVTDFGCSTNKFAEPDVEAFGALFVNAGQSIGYIGNTSLGFTSTSMTMPIYFYEKILNTSSTGIGAAATESKLKMFNTLGSTGTYRIFAYTSALVGDPIAKLALPKEPNFLITPSDYNLLNQNPTDSDDSVSFAIKFFNTGTAINDTVEFTIRDIFNNATVFEKRMKLPVPDYSAEITASIPVKNRAGSHLIYFIADESNEITEKYEDDNSIEVNLNVASVSIRNYGSAEFSSSDLPKYKIINNSLQSGGSLSRIVLQIDTTLHFHNPQNFTKTLDTFYTRFDFNNLINNTRYFSRTRIDGADTVWSLPSTFFKASKSLNFSLVDNYSLSNQELLNTAIVNHSASIVTDTSAIVVKSGGGNYSKFGSITLNGINVLPNTFSWGFGIAVFDQNSFALDTAMSYWSGASIEEATKLTNLVNSIDTGKIVAMCVIDDGSSNLNANLKTAIKTIGSTKVDQIGFRMPWTIIGIKGGAPGTAKEAIQSNSFQGILSIDTTFIRNRDKGSIVTQTLTDAGKWNSVHIEKTEPVGSQIRVRPIGIKPDGSADTLNYLAFTSDSASISALSVKTYPSLKFQIEMERGTSPASPVLKSFGVNYDLKPEIGVNYQTVSPINDTVFSGENIALRFRVYNAGDYKTDSFTVAVDVVNPDNSRNRIYNSIVTSLGAESYKEFNVSYTPLVGASNRKFAILIDPDNKIDEFYKDNNIYEIPFVIKPDTSDAFVVVKNNNGELFDGEFLSAKPKIRIELHDPSLLPVNDTANVLVTLNDERIFYTPGLLNYTFSNNNPKMVVEYTPTLSSGEYELNIKAKNALGALLDSAGITKQFVVSNETKLMNVYPYPNPSNGPVNFTFVLPVVPDELKIKIYTIAGRLIREISRSGAELKNDFNYVPWDGRDEDGAELANGVYLYKLYIKKDGKQYSETHKLAIVR